MAAQHLLSKKVLLAQERQLCDRLEWLLDIANDVFCEFRQLRTNTGDIADSEWYSSLDLIAYQYLHRRPGPVTSSGSPA